MTAVRGSANRLYPVEWICCALWVVFWATLAYVALTERSITLGGGRISHASRFDGGWAVGAGLTMAGIAAFGVGWLLRLNPYHRLLRFMLFVAWLIFVVAYVALAPG